MYRIIIKKKAKKFIDKLPFTERERIAYAIERLPNGEDIKKLKGYDELLRLRVGEYRIIYSVDNGELIVYVVDAGNRGDIYKRYRQGAVKITIQQKIDMACDAAGISRAELTRRLGTSESAFKQRLNRGKFKQEELDTIATILGCKYFSGFEFPDGLTIKQAFANKAMSIFIP